MKVTIIQAGKKAPRIVPVERLWRSLKYEDVYLKAYESVSEARVGIKAYFEYYNRQRRHQGIAKLTPDEAYFNNLDRSKAA